MSLPTNEDTPTWDMGAVLRPFWLLPPPSPPPPVCFALHYYVPVLTDERTFASYTNLVFHSQAHVSPSQTEAPGGERGLGTKATHEKWRAQNP